ncbi:MAG TPA: hypothetical protein VIT65_02160 [Microlunatus sp.]
MTVSTKVISLVYPVAGGFGAALVAQKVLEAARRFVVGKTNTPSGRGSGGTALVWTVLSWAVAGGVGLYTGNKLVRPAPVSSGTSVQPAQS